MTTTCARRATRAGAARVAALLRRHKRWRWRKRFASLYDIQVIDLVAETTPTEHARNGLRPLPVRFFRPPMPAGDEQRVVRAFPGF